jgi:hypothetical protein
MTLSVSARQVTPRPGTKLGGENTTLSIPARCRRRPGCVEVLGVKQGDAPE